MSSSKHQQVEVSHNHSSNEPPSNEVEMNNLGNSSVPSEESHHPVNPDSNDANASTTATSAEMTQPPAVSSEAPVQTSTAEPISTIEDPVDPSSTTTAAAPTTTSDPSAPGAPALTRLDTVAIGPATESPSAGPVVDSALNPVCSITLLLTSGARHPYKLDEKYLTKRNVSVPEVTEAGKKDPFSISVYTLKELILREWREEWEAKPSSPSSIRLIHFGKLLDDKTPLKECRFNPDSPNVVHMSIKPQEMVDDEEASKSKALRGEREGTENTPGCRCVIL